MKFGNQLSSEMQVVGEWLDENDLIINLSKGKTESMLLGTSRKIQNNSLNVYLDDKLINFTTKYRYLGVLIDQTVNLKEHFGQAFKKASGRLRMLKKIRASLTVDAAESYIYIYVIYLLRGPDEKNCTRGLENVPSPSGSGRFQDREYSFSHPDRSCR